MTELRAVQARLPLTSFVLNHLPDDVQKLKRYRATLVREDSEANKLDIQRIEEKILSLGDTLE